MPTQHSNRAPIVDANQRYAVDEACDLLRIGRARLYAHVKSGALRILKDGRRTYVPGSEIIALSRLPEVAAVSVS